MIAEGISNGDARYAIRYPTYTEGDIASNMATLADMSAVASIDADKLERTGKRPKEIFAEYFAALGNAIYSEEFGDIALGNSSVKSEIRHGLTAEKIASIEAIPSVIEKGKVIFSRKKPGTDVERIVVAAPIKIGAVEYYMGVMLQRDSAHQRLYLHNVATTTKEEANLPSQDDSLTNWSDEGNSLLLITSILQNALNVKAARKKNSSTRRYSLPESGESADFVYTREQYERFGWARGNDVLTAAENEDYRSKFAALKSGRAKFKRTKSGEYMIPVSEVGDPVLEGVNRKIVYAKGTISDPVITRVLEIDLDNETELSEKRREIYALERRGIQQTTGGVFVRYTPSDVQTFAEYARESDQNVGYNDESRSDRGTGSGEADGTLRGASRLRYSLPEATLAATEGSVRARQEEYEPRALERVTGAAQRAYIEGVNAQYGIERLLRKNGMSRAEAESLMQITRAAESQAQAMIGGRQYDIFSDNPEDMGEGLMQILEPVRRWSDERQTLLQQYLLHSLNVDRMTLLIFSAFFAKALVISRAFVLQ